MGYPRPTCVWWCVCTCLCGGGERESLLSPGVCLPPEGVVFVGCDVGGCVIWGCDGMVDCPLFVDGLELATEVFGVGDLIALSWSSWILWDEKY
jgi:hypothetical protein